MHESIVGPSHCVRLKHALETGQLPDTSWLAKADFICVGGMPIWSPRITRDVRKDAQPFFIVGDFRFGNAVLKDRASEGQKLAILQEYLAVDKDLISEQNDQILFDLCREHIRLHSEHYRRGRYLFWDLSIREYENRKAGKYRQGGGYQHPVWNLEPILSEFEGAAVDSRDMLEWGSRMYIDSSGHPSLIGWLYIIKHLQGKYVNLAALVQRFDQSLSVLMAELFGGRKILITGDSKFTRILERYLADGLFQLPAGSVILPIQKAFDITGYDKCLFFPSTTTQKLRADEVSTRVANVRHLKKKLAATAENVSVIFYDNWALESISRRKDYLNAYICEHLSGRTAGLEEMVCDRSQGYRIGNSDNHFESMLELNNTLLPTTLGLIEILGRSVSECAHSEILDKYQSMLAYVTRED